MISRPFKVEPDGPRLVHLDRDFLAAGQQVVFGERVAMGNLVEHVAAGDYLHRAVPGIRWGEGGPSRHYVGLAQAPVGRILVPGDEGRIGLLFDKEIRRPAEEVWPVKVFLPHRESADGGRDLRAR